MRSSILICATCLLVTGCSAQLRFPSLSSALSSLTGFGSGASSGSSSGSAGQSSSSSSPYSGLVRDYGRNLMMAMSSMYPSFFKPPQAQQSAPSQAQQAQQQQQSPFEQLAASQPLQTLFAAAGNAFPSSQGSQGQSGPSFSFGGSTFSISPSLPFGSLTGASNQAPSAQGPPQQQGSHSPFSASFGSSINSPPSFGPLSSSPFGFQSQSLPSFAPASSYNAAFEAANGGPNAFGSPQPSFHSSGAPSAQSSVQLGQSSQQFQSLPASFGSSSFDSGSLLSPSVHQAQNLPPPSFGSPSHGSSFMSGIPPPPPPQSASPSQQQQNGNPLSQQSPQPAASAPQPSQVAPQSHFSHQSHHSSQQYRPEMLSMAASAPVPNSNSYSNYGNLPSNSGQQAPASPSYQQPSYR